MSYRWIDHTAELELELEAATEEAVFREATAALAELMMDERPWQRGEPRSIAVAVAGHDRALLLADWLDEIVFRAETDGLVPQTVERLELGDAGLSATISAISGDPRPLVKGVTHHRLSFEPVCGGFRAKLVLDV